ncbi:hypothetical protein CRUP_013990, partial [Coryphaenoides rupestris]
MTSHPNRRKGRRRRRRKRRKNTRSETGARPLAAARPLTQSTPATSSRGRRTEKGKRWLHCPVVSAGWMTCAPPQSCRSAWTENQTQPTGRTDGRAHRLWAWTHATRKSLGRSRSKVVKKRRKLTSSGEQPTDTFPRSVSSCYDPKPLCLRIPGPGMVHTKPSPSSLWEGRREWAEER